MLNFFEDNEEDKIYDMDERKGDNMALEVTRKNAKKFVDKIRRKVTRTRLKKAGFKHEDLGHVPPHEIWTKGGVEIWDYNGKCWIIDILDEAGIDVEIKYMDELELFFKACKLEL